MGVEPTFAVPVTAKNLEDSPDYAPMIGLTFSSERIDGELYWGTESERHEHTSAEDQGDHRTDVDKRVIHCWCHVCFLCRMSYERVLGIPSVRSRP